MRLLAYILLLVLSFQFGVTHHLCGADTSCHEETVMAERSDATHTCCSHAKEQAPDTPDCEDDCSCNCCRVLINVYTGTASLTEVDVITTSQPLYIHGLHMLNLGPAIWEPPRV